MMDTKELSVAAQAPVTVPSGSAIEQNCSAPGVLPTNETTSLMDVISRSAANPSVDVDKLERLMGLYERMKAEKASAVFDTAMNSVQTQLQHVATDSDNEHTTSRYASYAALDNAIRPIYTAEGFSIRFGTGDGAPENVVRVTCRVSHSGGHYEDYHIDMPADGKGARGGDMMTKTHAVGSAVTYGRRYLLSMIFNIVTGDDDGNAAGSENCLTVQHYDKLVEMLEDTGANPVKFVQFVGLDPKKQCSNMPDALERLKLLSEKKYQDAVRAINEASVKRETKK